MSQRGRIFCTFCMVITTMAGLQLLVVYQHSIIVNDFKRFRNVSKDYYMKNTSLVVVRESATEPPTDKEPSGFDIALKVRDICQQISLLQANEASNKRAATRTALLPRIMTSPARKLFYCPVEKIGTTFWRRTMFALKSPTEESALRRPFNVTIAEALKWSNPRHMSLSTSNETLSFYFVRDPYSRLLSAFVDKLVSPNPIYWRLWGKRAVALSRRLGTPGHDVTFAEFVAMVAHSERTGIKPDSHFSSISRLCSPCSSRFTFIGRMENFKADTLTLLRRLKLNSYATAVGDDFEKNTVDDAIVDSVTGPFEWKNDTVKIISWDKALKRIWLKLQMRGIISKRKELSLSGVDIVKITRDKFIELVRKAHQESSQEELRVQKALVKQEAFATVPRKYLDEFREAFKTDFDLFGYNATPPYIMHSGNTNMHDLIFFEYTHLT